MLGQNQKTEQRYGLTQSQMSIWTGQMLNPEVPLYNMVYTFDLKGEIDAGHFQKAFWGLIERSDALRTVFDVSNNDPHQQILSTLDYEIEILDWSGQNFSEEKLKKWLDERSQRVLDLSKRTFDSVLIKISGKRFVWYFNQHHLATDARSSSILFKKMSELYEMSVAGQIAEVSPFPAFVHYIKHEKEIRRNAEREAVNDYWQKKIDSLPNAPRLYGRSDFEVTTRSKRFVIDLGIERSRALRNLTKESDLRAFTSDLSLFNIFATVLFSYLHRTTGQNKLAIGTPVHNRTTLEFKETPGLFIEFFPFAGEVQNDDTFTSLFKRISMETYEFLRNAQTGAGTPDLNRSFNVILNYINTDFPEFNGIPGEARWLHPNHSDASHHLRLHVYNDKRSDTVQLYFDLNCGVFDESKFEDIPRHFLKLLDAFIEDRTQAIIKTSLLGEAEFQKIVVDFNKQTEIGEKGVLELFQTQVRENPQNIAISDKTQNFSYAVLDKRSNKLANYLIEKGITDGERVGLYLKRSSDLLVGIFGALKAGCVYVPIAANNPPERVAEKINISESAIVLTHRELAENLEGLQTPVLRFDEDWKLIEEQEPTKPNLTISPENLAYIMFTSGSTGTPKGVKIAHRALGNYVNFAGKKYGTIQNPKFPLFTTIDFDLTITSIFVPLAIGGSIVIYEESDAGPDLAVLDVIEDDQIDIIKLTPSHLSLLKESDLSDSKIKTMIVGGEDLKADLAGNISDSFHDNLTIYNEYGPTEATVGCILHRFEADNNTSNSVPIGVPFANTKVYVLDENLNPVPPGVAGKLYLSGKSLADGYWNQFELTDQKFIPNPFEPSAKMYDTGDFVRLNGRGELEYLGRRDQQVKVGGIRMELGEIESAISSHPEISVCVVELVKGQQQSFDESEGNCFRCGLPRNYPTAEFDEKGVCNFCLSFESYRQAAQKYFKTPADLQKIFDEVKAKNKTDYDCLMLLSGGKDSTFALAQLVKMGLRVLTFTLDNGYISEEAKANIKRVVDELGVEHIFGKTPAMNAIFVDSLKRHKNVCNGCFKTIYTLSMKVALEKNIPFIVTGLSRGQFFETRLTEELFWKDDVGKIDEIILDARKAYHRVDDAVKKFLDTSVFDESAVFEKVQFIDFYRYFDVEFEGMMKYLDERLPWIRPTDTGRSTNCLINQVGIYVHKKEQGYSNYAFPYSWDVRMGHKTREVSLDEINEEIDEVQVKKIMREIGYRETVTDAADEKYLVAYFVSSKDISPTDLRKQLAETLPAYMIPARFISLDSFPLNANGKVDRKALRDLTDDSVKTRAVYVTPENEIEEILAAIWSEVLQIEKIGTSDNFLELGGHSLAAIRIMTRANDAFDLELPLNKIFEMPTIATLSEYIEKTILQMLNELNIQ